MLFIRIEFMTEQHINDCTVQEKWFQRLSHWHCDAPMVLV